MLPDNPGFLPPSDARLEEIALLKQRALAGEKIPLSELVSFLTTSEKSLAKERKQREHKPTDVDYF